MLRSIAAALCVLLGVLNGGCSRQPSAQGALAYPPAPRDEQTDIYHGTRVADPYRWLEQLDSPATRDWVVAQNTLSEPILRRVEARARIEARLRTLWNYPRTASPVQRAGRYFYAHNDGLQDQSVLYVTRRLDADARVLLDPNALSDDATVAVTSFVPSPAGDWLAYAVSDGGTDWKHWRIRNVSTGEDLPEILRGTKFSSVSWSVDGRGFYYSRYPLDAEGEPDGDRQVAVYYHRLDTPQQQDRPVFSVDDHPRRDPYAEVSDDGRYLVLTVFEGFSANGLYYLPLGADGVHGEPVRLLDEWDARYTFLGNRGAELLIQTNRGAPNGRVVAVDVRRPDVGQWRDVVPETADALQAAVYAGGHVVAHHLHDVRSQLRVHALDGALTAEIELPGIGSVSALQGRPDSDELFYTYTDFVTPATLFRYDLPEGGSAAIRRPDLPIEAERFVTRQVFYPSRDGTQIPMFLVYAEPLQLDGTRPTLLYGYGGFNSPQLADYQAQRMVWLEMGGVLAIANIRGGSEYGEQWHVAGTQLQKQNVFDDFIAAAEWLIAENYTSPDKLAIQGRSNGGLLVGAVMTQRPELFGAALPIVGVLDMLRYHTPSANARSWSSDYGLAEDAEHFEALHAYSPYHNVRSGVCYPPTLITTADHDDRVVPWHSYKFAAALQHAQACANPVLIRIETRAGHNVGKPVWMRIEDFADQWAFLVTQLDMEVDWTNAGTAAGR